MIPASLFAENQILSNYLVTQDANMLTGRMSYAETRGDNHLEVLVFVSEFSGSHRINYSFNCE